MGDMHAWFMNILDNRVGRLYHKIATGYRYTRLDAHIPLIVVD